MQGEMQSYFPVRREHVMESPLIFSRTYVVVLKSLPEKVIHLAHKGHQGLVLTKQHIRELYWWSRMDAAVHAVLSSCTVCQSCDKSARAHSSPFKPVAFPEGPFQHIAMDMVGTFEHGPTDCRFISNLVD